MSRCDMPHERITDTGANSPNSADYEALMDDVARLLRHRDSLRAENEKLKAENIRMRDALTLLDNARIIGAAIEPGIGHEAFWAIVRRGLGEDA